MENLQSKLDAIDAALATGELQVRHADRMVIYRSVEELMKARAMLLRVNGAPRAPFATARFNEDYR
jgi:hypothetical protein